MCRLTLFLIPGLLFAQDPISVSGSVRDALTGAPIAKATVILRSATQSGETKLTKSDAEGKYQFVDLASGTFFLHAEKSGYLRLGFGPSTRVIPPPQLTLKPGEKLTVPSLKLHAHSVITGRVVDEDDEPVERVMVQVAVLRGGQLAPMQGGPTNDLGEFRISGLGAGKYYLVTQGMQRGTTIDRRGYLTTYYPSTTEVAAAVPVELQAGQNAAPVVIRLQQGSLYRLRGRVQGIAGGDRSMGVRLIPRRDPAVGRMMSMGFSMNQGGLRPDGTFELGSVAPGVYDLVLTGQSGAEWGHLPVTVTQSDLDDLVILAQAPVSVRGIVRFDGETTASMTNLRIFLYPALAGTSLSQAQPDAKGAFTLNEVGRQVYRMNLEPGKSAYVKRVLLGGQDRVIGGLDFSNGAADLEIVLGTKPASLTANVRREETQTSPGSVLLVPEGAAYLSGGVPLRIGIQTVAMPGPKGQFEFSSLPPGKYQVLAAESILVGVSIPEAVLKQLQSRMTTIEIEEGETKSVSLTQLSRKEMAEFGLDTDQ